jgi:hypothetical protein
MASWLLTVAPGSDAKTGLGGDALPEEILLALDRSQDSSRRHRD